MTPFFPAYSKQVEDLSGTVVKVHTLPNCRPSAKILKDTLTRHPNIRCFLINDPCNPTGIYDYRDTISLFRIHYLAVSPHSFCRRKIHKGRAPGFRRRSESASIQAHKYAPVTRTHSRSNILPDAKLSFLMRRTTIWYMWSHRESPCWTLYVFETATTTTDLSIYPLVSLTPIHSPPGP